VIYFIENAYDGAKGKGVKTMKFMADIEYGKTPDLATIKFEAA